MVFLSSEEEADLRLLAAQYFQLVEPQLLTIPQDNVLVKHEIQESIYQTMFNEDAVWPLPPSNYRSRALRILLSRIEQSIRDPEEDEVSDNLMGCYSEILASPRPSPLEEAQRLSYITYTPPRSLRHRDSQSVITSENRGLILSSGTTGFRTWEAALHLGTFLSTPEGKALVHGKDVVELGAGTGFISMHCIKNLGANSVTATDREPALIANIQDSLALNKLESSNIKALIWEWGSLLTPVSGNYTGEERFPAFDVALGADLIYDVDLVPLLVATLRDLFSSYGVTAFLMSATVRNEKTFATFLHACETNSFNTYLLNYESPPRPNQDGFFHNTDVPIRTYKITPSLGT